MSEDVWLWAWGALGAFMFAGLSLGTKLFADPGADSAADRRRLRLALYTAGLAVLTGAVTAQVFAELAQGWAAHLVKLPKAAAAVIIGCAANSLWPKFVRRLEEKVDQIKLPGDKT